MSKPKVYIETSVISYLTARPSNDLRTAANQVEMVDWWDGRRSQFDIYVSSFVVAEASKGHPDAASLRPKIESVCRSHGVEPPIICTPTELMED